MKKTCRVCKLNKGYALFSKNKRNKDGLKTRCKECDSEYKRDYYLKNKEKVQTDSKQWYEDNREHGRAERRRYYQENKEYMGEINKQYRKDNKEELSRKAKDYREQNPHIIEVWRESNKEHIKEYRRQYRDKNREELNQATREWRELNKTHVQKYSKEYQKQNPHIDRQSGQRRRASKAKLDNSLTLKEWDEIKENFDYRCAYCGTTEEEHLKRYGEQLHQEHFMALSNGGEYTHNNIIPSCKSCNSSKHNKCFFEWYPKYELYDKSRECFVLEYLNYKQSHIQQLSIL